MTARASVTKTTEVDGHTVTFKFIKRDAPRYVYPERGRPYLSSSWREYDAKPRLYVDVADESLLDNLLDRTSRPYNVWRPFLKQAFLNFKFNNVRLTWSQKAGCSCPCSPGFIVSLAPSVSFPGDPVTSSRYDIWATIEGAPAVRDDAAAQAEQAARFEAIAYDPTLPLDRLAATRLS